ncbi:hypothetical protein [Nitrosomonas nitrosa]|nr:hypothetical protein [Nitrosomonas nitrosa]
MAVLHLVNIYSIGLIYPPILELSLRLSENSDRSEGEIGWLQ